MLRLFNTLTRQVDELVPLKKGEIRMYTCGPTVYNYPHLGNYRAYIVADLVRRHLIHRGLKTTQVMNITDVDDKTIRDSRKEGKSLRVFTEHYTKAFFDDLAALRIKPADIYCKATDHIPEMISLIECLLKNKHAYKADDGSVYFKVASFNDYGKLAHLDLDTLKSGASGRVVADEYSKDDPHDFALWKAYSDDDGDVSWDSPFGRGRPGWHIECSAMAMRYLGQSFDIHTGGVDLVFPHHQNEIAQSEGCSHKPFVRHWVHNEWLLVDGEKMSKSKGTFHTLRDVVDRGFSPPAIRYVLFSTHYRQQLNFTFESLDAAQNAIERLQNCVVALQQHKGGQGDGSCAEVIANLRHRFDEAMDDDLNAAQALAALFDFVKDVNTKVAANALSEKDAKNYLDALRDVDEVLGVMSFDERLLDHDVEALIKEREDARKRKDFATSDRIRDELKRKGIVLEDTSAGLRWKRA